MNQVTTIVADFGGVLSSPLEPAHGAAHAGLGITHEALGAAMGALEAERGVGPLHELETGLLSETDFFRLVQERMTAATGTDVVLDDYAALYWAALERNDELIDHLAGRKAEGYRLGLLTNNVREWEPRWKAMLPADLFEVIVDSACVGVRKPDPEIYRLTEERLGVPGAEIVFLDDFAVNCEAARAAGWTAVRHEETARTIAELDAILGARGAPPRVGARASG